MVFAPGKERGFDGWENGKRMMKQNAVDELGKEDCLSTDSYQALAPHDIPRFVYARLRS